jgi:hypothetical protein
MTRFTKSGGGKYKVQGKNFDMLIGTRAQVWHGTAFKTSGGLTKSNLMQNKHGRIVSRAKHSTAKKENRLVKSGYGTKKGTFGFVKLGKSKSKRGGASGLFGSMNSSSGPSAPTSKPSAPNTNTTTSSNTTTNTKNNLPSNPPSLPKAPSMNKTGGRRARGGKTRKGGKSKYMSGGMYALTPHPYDGKGQGTSGVNLQFVAGNSG